MSGADKVEEIMARAICERRCTYKCVAKPFVPYGGEPGPIVCDCGYWADNLVGANAAIAALHAHGYKITKDDPDMLSIPEVSTDRPIGR